MNSVTFEEVRLMFLHLIKPQSDELVIDLFFPFRPGKFLTLLELLSLRMQEAVCFVIDGHAQFKLNFINC